MDENIFNQQKYITKYSKENYVNFSTKIKPELNEKIVSYCKAIKFHVLNFWKRRLRC